MMNGSVLDSCQGTTLFETVAKLERQGLAHDHGHCEDLLFYFAAVLNAMIATEVQDPQLLTDKGKVSHCAGLPLGSQRTSSFREHLGPGLTSHGALSLSDPANMHDNLCP